MEVRLPRYTIEGEADVLPLSARLNWGISKYLGERPEDSGEGILCAVFDEGVDRHDQIKDNIVYEKSFTNDGLKAESGHGVHVAGTIAAKDPRIGIAHKAKLANFRVLSKSGGNFAWLEAACYDLIDLHKQSSFDATICNMSLGADYDYAGLHKGIKEMIKAGIIVVCAAGNDGPNLVDFPAAYPETIAVAAIDKYEKVTSFSSKGKEVTIAAPGNDIWSLMGTNRYALQSGTSMATPFVTGMIARYLSQRNKQLRSKTFYPVNMPTMGIQTII